MPNLGDFIIGGNQALHQAISSGNQAVNAISGVQQAKNQAIFGEMEKVKLNQMREEEARLNMPIYMSDMTPMFEKYPKQSEAMKKTFGHLIQKDPTGGEFLRTRDLKTVHEVLSTNHQLQYELATAGLADIRDREAKIRMAMSDPKTKPEEQEALKAQLVQTIQERNGALGTIEAYDPKLMQKNAEYANKMEIERFKKETPQATTPKVKEAFTEPKTGKTVYLMDTGGLIYQDGNVYSGGVDRLLPIKQKMPNITVNTGANKPKMSDVKAGFDMAMNGIKARMMLDMTPDEQIAIQAQPAENVLALLMAGKVGKAMNPNAKKAYIDEIKSTYQEYGSMGDDVLGRKGLKKPPQQTVTPPPKEQGGPQIPPGYTDTGKVTNDGRKIYQNAQGQLGTLE